jgi:UDP-glucose 4-epimerase
MNIKGMNVMVTGGAGFIGSCLVDRLVQDNDVLVYDNLSGGRKEFIEEHIGKKNFKFAKADILDKPALKNRMKGIDIVFHIAANPDIRYGTRKTSVDLEQGTIATYNVLEAMRLCDVDKISYSSSSVVYGEADIVPTPEDYGPLVPLSLYGASKLACEGLISSFSNSFGMRSWLFRFANIIGRRGTHGVLVDFTEKLKKNPRELEILGDGTQTKSYLMVDECVDGMLFGTEESGGRVNIFNLGSTDRINVTRIAEILVEEAGLRGVKFNYTGGDRGWAGDIPKFLLSTEKIQRLGWKPRLGSEDAVRTAAKLVIAERWKAAKKKGNVRKG